jgi:hypothetical protein
MEIYHLGTLVYVVVSSYLAEIAVHGPLHGFPPCYRVVFFLNLESIISIEKYLMFFFSNNRELRNVFFIIQHTNAESV